MKETGNSPREMLDVYQGDKIPEVSKRNRQQLRANGRLIRAQILSWENDLSRHEEKSVVVTFIPALNRIQHTAPDAVTLLRIFCFCDPEGIPISIFQQGCNALYQEDRDKSPRTRAMRELKVFRSLRHLIKRVSSGSQQKSRHGTFQIYGNNKLEAVKDLLQSRIRLSKAIQEIQRLSLAAQTVEDTDRIIRIHDLVHFLLRSKLMTDEERGQWLEIAICIVDKGFEEIGDRRSPQNWSQCDRFISHIESLEGFAKQYRLGNIEILDASTWAAVYLIDCGLYDKAAMLNKQILERQKNILGKKHPSTLTSMNNLAGVLASLGKYGEAEGIYRQTLALRESILGKKHPDTLVSVYCLAYLLHSVKRYKDAELIYQRACAGYKVTLGDSHPTTTACLQHYSSMCREANGES
ncbi:MAG: hypothetical protein Q9217_005794 [Psora testacea]